jgi:hypothetical protein
MKPWLRGGYGLTKQPAQLRDRLCGEAAAEGVSTWPLGLSVPDAATT